MKIGHIRLTRTSDDEAARFAALVEKLDLLAVRQHLIVADDSLARRFRACPYVSVAPTTASPVLANCLMPDVDLVHAHDARSGRAALLLTLTRSIPFVLSRLDSDDERPAAMRQMILDRAQGVIAVDELDADGVLGAYRRARDAWSELPQDSDRR